MQDIRPRLKLEEVADNYEAAAHPAYAADHTRYPSLRDAFLAGAEYARTHPERQETGEVARGVLTAIWWDLTDGQRFGNPPQLGDGLILLDVVLDDHPNGIVPVVIRAEEV